VAHKKRILMCGQTVRQCLNSKCQRCQLRTTNTEWWTVNTNTNNHICCWQQLELHTQIIHNNNYEKLSTTLSFAAFGHFPTENWIRTTDYWLLNFWMISSSVAKSEAESPWPETLGPRIEPQPRVKSRRLFAAWVGLKYVCNICTCVARRAQS